MDIHSRDVMVYTAVFGDQAPPSDDQVVCQSSFLAVSNSPVSGELWDTKVIGGDSLTALFVKLHPHLFVKTPYSVWIDPAVRLHVPPIELIEKHLDGYDLALMKHPSQTCVYGAAHEAIVAGLDKPQVIRRQMATYRGERFPPHYGFSDTTVLVCRHTPGLLRFLAAWWEAIRRGSAVSYLSFDHTRWKHNFPVNHLTAGDFDPPQVSPPALCFAPQGSEFTAQVAVS